MLLVARERLLEVLQVLPGVHAAVAADVDGQHAVPVVGDDFLDDERLVDGGAHGDGVVAGPQDEVLQRRGADEVAGDVVAEGHVAHGDGHDGGVGDQDGAEHVGAVGLGEELDVEVEDLEAGEAVEACMVTVCGLVRCVAWLALALTRRIDITGGETEKEEKGFFYGKGRTVHGDGLLVADVGGREPHFVQVGSALDDGVDCFSGQELVDVVCESV